MLRGFHSRRLGTAEKDAAGEGKTIVCSILEHGALLTLPNPPGPPLTFRSSQHLHYDYQSLLAWTPTDCNPPVSPQPQVFPTDPASAAPVPALTSLKSWVSFMSHKSERGWWGSGWFRACWCWQGSHGCIPQRVKHSR